MKRLALLMGIMVCTATPSFAISEFGRQWKDAYLGSDADPDWVRTGRKAGCYVCHVKGEDKKKVRNEYGEAVHEFLDAEDFPRDYVKANPEEAKAKIREGFKKAGEKKSSDGRTFAAKIEANELPATDAGL